MPGPVVEHEVGDQVVVTTRDDSEYDKTVTVVARHINWSRVLYIVEIPTGEHWSYFADELKKKE